MLKTFMKSFEKKLFSFKNPKVEAEVFISYLENPARKLLGLLKEKIDKKEYDSVLGDDAEARIHTLVLGNAIKEIYGDQKHLEIVFVQGGALLSNPSLAPEHTGEVKMYLDRMKDKLGKRTLIVTEEILGGTSVEKLALILKSLEIEADVATFQVAEPEAFDSNPIITPEGIMIFNGEGIGGFMLKEHLGVWDRTRSGEGHAVARQPIDKLEQQQIRAAREAAKSLAHKLADEYSNTTATETPQFDKLK